MNGLSKQDGRFKENGNSSTRNQEKISEIPWPHNGDRDVWKL